MRDEEGWIFSFFPSIFIGIGTPVNFSEVHSLSRESVVICHPPPRVAGDPERFDFHSFPGFWVSPKPGSIRGQAFRARPE